jgi:hypothetical protein
MTDRIVSTRLLVDGVSSDADVVKALQSLYDVFADLGLGQATFEVTDIGTAARLWVKHLDSVDVDLDAINIALAKAGAFRIVG